MDLRNITYILGYITLRAAVMEVHSQYREVCRWQACINSICLETHILLLQPCQPSATLQKAQRRHQPLMTQRKHWPLTTSRKRPQQPVAPNPQSSSTPSPSLERKKKAYHPPNPLPSPHNSTRACLAVLGSSLAIFCSVGFVNAFGVFQEYYFAHQLRRRSEFDISWVGSFATFAMFMWAPVAGVLVDRMGPTVRFAFSWCCFWVLWYLFG